MRVIDADALRDRMYHDTFETDSDMQKWDGGCWIRYKLFENAIEEAPTIEQQPERKKGFWYTLKKGDKGYSAGDFKCSVCGEPNHTWLPKPKFCPNCGADMSVYEEPVKISLGIN